MLLKSTLQDPRGFTCKLCDFGLSRMVTGGQLSPGARSALGTLAYMPPEVLLDGRLSMAADIYSFGLISNPIPPPHAVHAIYTRL